MRRFSEAAVRRFSIISVSNEAMKSFLREAGREDIVEKNFSDLE